MDFPDFIALSKYCFETFKSFIYFITGIYSSAFVSLIIAQHMCYTIILLFTLIIIAVIIYLRGNYLFNPLKFKCKEIGLNYENLKAHDKELKKLNLNTGNLILSKYCETYFNFEVELTKYAKENIRKNKDCFTLIIEKAKTIIIKTEPNFFNSETDDISADDYIKYFYLFQEKSNPKKLQFNLKLAYEEIPDETDIKIFLEYGDKREEVNDCNKDLRIAHKFKNELKMINPIYENVMTNPPFRLE